MFSRPLSSGCRPELTSISAARRPRKRIEPAVGREICGEQLQRRRLAGAVGADEREALAVLDAEADVLERGPGALGGLAPADEAGELAAQRRVLRVAAHVALADVLEDDGGVHAHTTSAKFGSRRRNSRSPA